MTDLGASQAKDKFTVECVGFHSIRRNTLKGYACINISELKLKVSDVAIHQRDAQRWAQLPAKPMVRDGELVRDGPNKLRWVEILEFADPKVARGFSSLVCEAVERFEPDAFTPDPLDETAA